MLRTPGNNADSGQSYRSASATSAYDVSAFFSVTWTTASDNTAANVAGIAPQPRATRCTSVWPFDTSQSSSDSTS